MKRLIIVLLLVVIAAVAGVVRSGRGVAQLSHLPESLAGEAESTGDVREEIRQNYSLAPGARVLVAGINGPVNVETADVSSAEVYVERIGKSQTALDRRKVTVEGTSTNLTIRGKSGDVGLFARLFGSNPTEKVTLKVPRRISLTTDGINGAVTVGDVDGPVEAHGINGKVNIGGSSGKAEFHGINGNIAVALRSIEQDGVELKGVNGNIELRLVPGLNAELEARGMNGDVVSDLPDFVLVRAKHGSYSAHVGTGGNRISAHGINGNIRFTR
jgi:hypothetical protein